MATADSDLDYIDGIPSFMLRQATCPPPMLPLKKSRKKIFRLMRKRIFFQNAAGFEPTPYAIFNRANPVYFSWAE